MFVQKMIQVLSDFWSAQNCVIAQPYDHPMGAGTFHPETFLRAMQTKPWRVAYVQACRRPSDGRYGQNPNRSQKYFQFQVFLKPAPADFQSLYLQSLEILGIMPEKHDIRFVPDNWESPALGAYGVGWEVWKDGMEISQITYFQQIGGKRCSVISGEITYGVERLAMAVQRCANIYDLQWSASVSYADMMKAEEIDMSHYYFEYAPISQIKQNFEQSQKECCQWLDLGLIYPAYECVLQASHYFNILDARGTLSPSDRQSCILQIRKLAQTVIQMQLNSDSQS